KTKVEQLGHLLPSLVELQLSDGSILASFRDLGTSLRVLQVMWARACCVTDLDGVGALSGLRELYLAFNDVEDLTAIAMHECLEVSVRREGNSSTLLRLGLLPSVLCLAFVG
ncbi:unnamed protein product, partial [Choristocarpus tenellus]